MKLYVGATSPEPLRVTTEQGDTGFDLSTVTAGEIRVKKPNGAIATLAATITAQSPTSITLSHTFAAGEIDVAGPWHIYARHTVPGGFVRSEAFVERVFGEYDE